MTHRYISDLYRRGHDTEARRAIAREIEQEHQDPESDGHVDYTPTPAEIDAREAEYYAARRAYRYGPPERQMEYIVEHGLSAWKSEVAQIKGDVPKPVE